MANDDYDSLVKEKSDAESKRSAAQRRIDSNNAKLSRLRAAKKIMAAQKDDFDDIQKADKKTIRGSYSWQGSTFKTFQRRGEAVIDENSGYYKHSLDYVLDGINDEITRLENQNINEYGLLGHLGSLINSLANKIENFFN